MGLCNSSTRWRTATGSELAALDAFQRYTGAERTRIARARTDCNRRIAAQLDVVSVKRRRFDCSRGSKSGGSKPGLPELGRETDQQADEAYLAKWNRRRQPG
jgi:hypothetical protein